MSDPKVESLWTLHMVNGVPESIFLNHRLVDGAHLEHFFEPHRGATQLVLVADDVSKAVSAIWTEVALHKAVLGASQSRRTFDHVTRVLDENWAGRGSPETTHIRWVRELEVPNGRAAGPSVDIAIATMSDEAQDAVKVLDDAARKAGGTAVERAKTKHANW